MVDGRHFENRYIAISQRKIIRFRWNFVHISRFWTGWPSRDQKWKSRIGQTPSSTEHISCSMWMLCVLSCASKSDLCDYDDMRKIKKHLFSLHIIGLPLCSLSISSRQNICLVANIFMLFMYEQIQSRNFRLGRAQLETGRAGPELNGPGRAEKTGPCRPLMCNIVALIWCKRYWQLQYQQPGSTVSHFWQILLLIFVLYIVAWDSYIRDFKLYVSHRSRPCSFVRLDLLCTTNTIHPLFLSQ